MSETTERLRRIEEVVQEFVKECHGRSVSAGWYNDPVTGMKLNRNVPEMVCLIHSELSEGLEGYRKSLMDDKLPERLMLEVELADAMIRIADLAGYLNLDLGGAIHDKILYNAKRLDHTLEARKASGGKKF